MTTRTRPWGKQHASMLNHRKYLRLTPAQRAAWHLLFLYALNSESVEVLGEREDVEAILRMYGHDAADLDALVAVRLLDTAPGPEGVVIYSLHDWDVWQPVDPTGADRKARQREREREGGDTPAPEPAVPVFAPRDGLPHLDSSAAVAWERATGRSVLASGVKVQDYLDDACRRHPAAKVAAAIAKAREGFAHIPDVYALMSAIRPLLDPFVDSKEIARREREAEAAVASSRGVEATLRRNHEIGGHAEPHPRCPLCRTTAVARVN